MFNLIFKLVNFNRYFSENCRVLLFLAALNKGVTIIVKGTTIIPEKKWFAVYTKSRSEKRVYERLLQNNIESYLPLQKTLKQWSDRKKWVEQPLFTSYVFVHIEQKDYQSVLQTDGVVKFIGFEGRAVSIPEGQINSLKLLVDSQADIEVSTMDFEEGREVKVAVGPMKGLLGKLVKQGSKKRFIVRIDQINQSLLVNIPISYLIKEN